MEVLLSIKPEFAFKIFSGNKKYEFRRSIFKRSGIKKIVVYASAPISKVIGEFEIERVIYDELSTLWNLTSIYAGINENYFYKYFQNRDKGYAIKIKSVKRYDVDLCIKEHFNLFPPQSYVYLNK